MRSTSVLFYRHAVSVLAQSTVGHVTHVYGHRYTYRGIIFSDQYNVSPPVSSLTVQTTAAARPTDTSVGRAAWSDKRQWPDKIMILPTFNIEKQEYKLAINIPGCRHAVISAPWVCHSTIPSYHQTVTQGTIASVNLAQNTDNTQTTNKAILFLN
jgi:hypothetical protein